MKGGEKSDEKRIIIKRNYKKLERYLRINCTITSSRSCQRFATGLSNTNTLSVAILRKDINRERKTN